MPTRTDKAVSVLWKLTLIAWGVALLGWPLLSAIQALFGVKQPDLFDTGPWTLFDIGMLVFVIAAPLAFALTVFTWLGGIVIELKDSALLLVLGCALLLAVVTIAVVFAIYAAQVVGFFLIMPLLMNLFGWA